MVVGMVGLRVGRWVVVVVVVGSKDGMQQIFVESSGCSGQRLSLILSRCVLLGPSSSMLSQNLHSRTSLQTPDLCA